MAQVIDRPVTSAQADYLTTIIGWIREVNADDEVATEIAGRIDGFSKREASAAITVLKDYLRSIRTTQRAPEAPEPGFYLLGSEVYEVLLSRAGRPYAKRLSEVTGRFTYEKGAIYHLQGAEPMTLAEAAAYGRRTGRCCVCGRTLTNETSVQAGIGPVCSRRFA